LPLLSPGSWNLDYTMADTLRDATIADLDDMTEIMCSAMPMDPAWNYRFPRRKEFPEDHWRCVREDIEKIFDPGSRSHRSVKVITIPRTNRKGDRAVALAVWELPFLGHSEISSNSIAPSFHPPPFCVLNVPR